MFKSPWISLRELAMSERAWADKYEAAMQRCQPYLRRAEDGTIHLDVHDARSIGVDPIAFADLKRSLEVTNDKILRGEIRSSDIEL
jgi:hypothetical protein